jgi:hypothetical protein
VKPLAAWEPDDFGLIEQRLAARRFGVVELRGGMRSVAERVAASAAAPTKTELRLRGMLLSRYPLSRIALVIRPDDFRVDGHASPHQIRAVLRATPR